LRGGKVEVYGVRSSRGYRRLVSEQNSGVDLLLDFNPEMKANSDHYSFLSHHTPAIFFHTGLHDDYHRPSDDVDKINADGVRQTSTLIFKTAYELAEREKLNGYREGSTSESAFALESLNSSAPLAPARLGVTWDEHAEGEGVTLARVQSGSPAALAGLRVGDRIVAAAGRHVDGGEEFRKLVMAAENPLWLTVQRRGSERPLFVRVMLAGALHRVGLGWRNDEAEPESVIINRVVANSPAALAGLRVGERIYRVNGDTIAGSDDCSRRINGCDSQFALEVESSGRTRRVEITPLERTPSVAPEEPSAAISQ
jgi:C-terminal processing protease CtpA/Prc